MVGAGEVLDVSAAKIDLVANRQRAEAAMIFKRESSAGARKCRSCPDLSGRRAPAHCALRPDPCASWLYAQAATGQGAWGYPGARGDEKYADRHDCEPEQKCKEADNSDTQDNDR
jgi:hypothetical protein